MLSLHTFVRGTDGYCKELSLAFEYQGIQHYEPSSVFHAGRQTLGQRKADDARKRKLCRPNGVHLLAIPYTVELDDVPAYIVAAVKDLRVPVSMRPPDTIKVAQFVLPEQLRAMRALAREHDGECLSTAYVNSFTKLRWRCAEGHEWEAQPNNVKNLDNWCPACAGNLRDTIEQMQALAKAHDGVCLSTVYVNHHTKLRWRCSEGHEWEAMPSNVKNLGSSHKCMHDSGMISPITRRPQDEE